MTTAIEALARRPSARGLSTARSVLQVLALLIEQPDGVRASEVAGAVGKSTSTGYYLLESLCEEGFAVHEPGGLYRLRRDPAGQPQPRDATSALALAVDELFLRTRKRSYLGRVHTGAIEIVKIRGRQGMPKIPGLGTRITAEAHALAMGKIVLARLPDNARRRYAERGLKAFTPATITAPAQLFEELEDVRRQGYAIEREEFKADFCCVAAPVLDLRGRLVALLGVSATTHAFDAERSHLVEVVCRVASKYVPKNAQILHSPDVTP